MTPFAGLIAQDGPRTKAAHVAAAPGVESHSRAVSLSVAETGQLSVDDLVGAMFLST